MKHVWMMVLTALAFACAGCGEALESAEDGTAASQNSLATVVPAYTDSLASGWSDWSWAKRNMANRSPSIGKRSIAVTYGPWEGIYLHRAPLSTEGMTHLEVNVHGGSQSGQVLAASVTVNGENRTKVDVGSYCAGGSISASSWRQCLIPLEVIDAKDATIDGVVIQEFAGKSLGKLYLDNVRLVVQAPAAPAAPTAAADGGGVSLSWAAVPHASSYNVYRATSATGTFGKLTSLPVTGTTYRDTTAAAGSTFWYAVSAVNAAGESARSGAVSVTVPAAPVPEPEPTTEIDWLYRDALAFGWNDWSWANRSLSSTGTVAAGSRSISASFGAWQALYFVHDAYATSGVDSITLRVHGGSSGTGAALRVRAMVNGQLTSGADLGPTCAAGRVVAGQWTICTVPMVQVAPAGAVITGIQIQEFAGGSIPTIYFDEIGFVSGEATAPTEPEPTEPPPTEPADPVVVAVSPLATTLEPGATRSFTATVTGSADTSVTWSVQESNGGTIDAAGNYTAPGAEGTFHVVATSNADRAVSASATVRVEAPVVTPPPTSGAIDMSMLPADRRDTWNPGIPGGIPGNRQVHATLTNLTTDGRGDNAAAINQAILAAASAYASTGVVQEVVLPAGTIRVASTITLNRSGVVLRGQGMDRTRLRYDGTGEAIRIGRAQWTNFGAQHGPWNLQADAVKGSNQIVLSNADARKVLVGDILVIDEEDDTSFVRIGDARYEKRQPTADSHGPALRGAGLWRSVTSMIRVTGKSVGSTNTTLTLADPLHMNFRRARYAQVFQIATEPSSTRSSLDGVHYNGVEDLYFTGGNLRTNNAAFCWIKNVEVDGNPGTVNVGSYNNPGGITGRSVNLFHAYRCEVRGSYIHHSRNISQGGGAYLLSISSYTSESLIEDNIVVYGNKLVVGNMMGGGNVIAYNYVDNARTSHSSWQEGAIDLNHQSFTHTALVEGNQATNITSDTTHGNAGWHVFHRNYATGQNSNPLYGAYPYTSAPDGQYRRAAGTDGYHREATYIGNVLLAGGGSGTTYQVDTSTGSMINAATVWRIGWGVDGGGDRGDDGTALRLLYRHGNWDNVSNGIVWDAANANRTIPASLYRTSKPAFFGSQAWPWVNPQGTTASQRVGVLPAKARYDAMGAP